MNNLKFVFYFFLTLIGYQTSAQTFNGIIKNYHTGQPVEYVNIGIPLQNVGTISNEKGTFELKIEPSFINKSLLFSRIGYQDTLIRITDLKQASKSIVYFREQPKILDDIPIFAGKIKKKLFGKPFKTINPFHRFVLTTDSAGWELGARVKNRNRVVLEKLNFMIEECTSDSLILRVNVYEIKGEISTASLPAEVLKSIKLNKNWRIGAPSDYFKEVPQPHLINISRKPVYIKKEKREVKNSIVTLDMRPYNIIVNGDFLIGLELVKSLGPGSEVIFPATEKGILFKWASHGPWVDLLQTGIHLNVEVSVLKN